MPDKSDEEFATQKLAYSDCSEQQNAMNEIQRRMYKYFAINLRLYYNKTKLEKERLHMK